jgi:UDP-N-acetylglucosamine 2-epimerase (non-hydrolysing)
VPPHRVLVTGNPVIDALQWVAALPPTHEASDLLQRVGINAHARAWNTIPSMVRHAPKAHGSTVLLLVTAHRRENFGAPLEAICAALRAIAESYDGSVRIVYPVHPNPHVWEPVHRLLGNVPHITLTPPLEYLPFIHLMKHAALVLTDSGGLQEEAPSLGKPVLVLRAVTERPEGVEAGTVRVVGVDQDSIVTETVRLLEDRVAYDAMAMAVNPYGDGKASERIVQALLGTETSA